MLLLDEKIGDAPKQPVQEIKKFAHAVAITRASVVDIDNYFTTALTNVVGEFQKANISVYVYVLRNEFITLAFDYYSDPIVEIATLVGGARVDGIITEFPGTASKYMSKNYSSNIESLLWAAELDEMLHTLLYFGICRKPMYQLR